MSKSIATAVLLLFTVAAASGQSPKPVGKPVQFKGHRLHVHCTGKGSPTLVIENGFNVQISLKPK